MELETVNRLYLELSQVATAKTAEETRLFDLLKEANEVLRSAHEIAKRDGAETNWPPFRARLSACLARQHLVIYPAKTVFAWVIERDESHHSAPEYFTGKSHPAMRWSNAGDHAAACRFSRQQDAEAVALGFDPGRKHRIAEHGWDER